MQKKHQSLLAGTQKIKSWHSASSSMLANNELNKWVLLSNVLGEGGTQRKHSVSPNAATPSTWTTVQFLLLFVGLWFQQMDRAVLTPHEKQEVLLFSPLLPHALFLASCLLAAPCSGFVPHWICFWVSSAEDIVVSLLGQSMESAQGKVWAETARSSSFVSRETWDKASSWYHFLYMVRGLGSYPGRYRVLLCRQESAAFLRQSLVGCFHWKFRPPERKQ